MFLGEQGKALPTADLLFFKCNSIHSYVILVFKENKNIIKEQEPTKESGETKDFKTDKDNNIVLVEEQGEIISIVIKHS